MTELAVRSRGRRGFALVLVMMAVAAAMILALGFVMAQGTSAQMSRNLHEQARARVIAESGLEMAIRYVRSDSNWRSDRSHGVWVQDQPLAGGSFTIHGEDGEDTDGDGVVDGDGDLADDTLDKVTLTAIGNCQGAKHTVRAVVSPSKGMLMIVSDPTALDAEEITRRDLLAEWGWSVYVLDDDASAAEFDAAVASGVHVIYFPAHVTLQGGVADRLRTTSLPLVIEAGKLPKELKIADKDSMEFSDSAIEILELTVTYIDDLGAEVTEVVTHYITEPFPVGELTICSSPDNLLRLDGRIATGLKVLGDGSGSSTEIVLSVMVAGALGKDKKPAPGRRVVLPWGSDGFSVSSLNADGQMLLKRSLDWSASAWRGLMPGVAAWDKVEVKDTGYIDGFDSRIGPYGGGNVNADATVSTNNSRDDRIRVDGGQIRGVAYVPPNSDISEVVDLRNGGTITGGSAYLPAIVPMPISTEPTDMGSDTGDVVYSIDTEITANLYAKTLTITGDAVVTVSADVTILCKEEVRIEGNARLVINDGVTLTIYTKKRVTIQGGAQVNVDSADPTRLVWIVLKDKIEIKGTAQLSANVQAHAGEVKVQESSHFYGTFIGRHFKVEHSGAAHIDTGHSGTIITMGGGTDVGRLAGKPVRWTETP